MVTIMGAVTNLTWTPEGVNWTSVGADADHFRITAYLTDGNSTTVWGTEGTAHGDMIDFVKVCHCPETASAEPRVGEEGRDRTERPRRYRTPVVSPAPPADETPAPSPEPKPQPEPIDPQPETPEPTPIENPLPVAPTPEPTGDETPAPTQPGDGSIEDEPVTSDDDEVLVVPADTGSSPDGETHDKSSTMTGTAVRLTADVVEVGASSTRIVAGTAEVLSVAADTTITNDSARPAVTEVKALGESLPLTGIDTQVWATIALSLLGLGVTLLGATRNQGSGQVA